MADSHDAPHASLPAHLPGEAAISRLVHAFYGRARQDRLLGPVFEAAVQDWPAHMDTLVRFWSSVLLRTGTYRGNPMAAHQPLRLDEEHFARWLELWHATAHELLPAAQAGHVSDIAQRIGRSLRIGLGIDPLRAERRAAGGPDCHHHPHGGGEGQST
jgi:hemoglobin